MVQYFQQNKQVKTSNKHNHVILTDERLAMQSNIIHTLYSVFVLKPRPCYVCAKAISNSKNHLTIILSIIQVSKVV